MTDTETIVITDPDSDRYHTFGYISWWQQEVVRNATVMVIGAGALGNEVIKNLALMGIGNILIADFDTIEDSNLSRSVLFRADDRGRRKVDAAAEAAKAINPDVKVKAWHGDINYEMGLGVFRHVDAIVGCLDNREARLSINRFSWAVDRPWVDGAIQELMGIVRVFRPGEGACYECTLTDLDYQIINLRYSCPLLARQDILMGKVPTTPTSASIVAAFQTQEALKLLHDMEVQPGKALMINGLTNDIYLTEYPVKEACMSHSRLEPIIELPEATAAETTLADLLAIARERLGPEAVLEFDSELVIAMTCNSCGNEEPIFKRMARLYEDAAVCPVCGAKREMRMTHRITGEEAFLERTFAEVDVPPLGIVRARNGSERVYYELTGDKATFLQFA
ncbi:MAG: ThiF family adenylyltransferase [Anaerolineae bacterium]|uniref:HesA/MoeB/ThiF family protein n=1 Tax=Promineifilum sp. TaxID=2664178 RepID=UPI001D4593F9|nr:ThiF family adenylyltransferase [Anaerolineales bacterium]MCO5181857.1 ThiF family adenylyltransferase [Promineifilum sp.]MCW5846175.1 ThiF family adenylyltransferase [Anaerolineae bacterium]